MAKRTKPELFTPTAEDINRIMKELSENLSPELVIKSPDGSSTMRGTREKKPIKTVKK